MTRPPCNRIQLDFEDGTQQFAFGERAEAIIRYWELCQRIANQHMEPAAPPPQFETLPGTMTEERLAEWMIGAPGDKNRVDIPIGKVVTDH